MQKTYLPDASVYLVSPRAIYAFEDNQVLIPSCVLQEMMDAAKEPGPYRANAIEFNQLLDNIFNIDKEQVAALPNKGSVRLIINDKDIYKTAQQMEATIVSRDPAVRVRARTMYALHAEPFRAEQTPKSKPSYMGRCNLYVSPDEMDEFAKKKELFLNPDESYYATDPENKLSVAGYRLTMNEYVTLINSCDPEASTMLGRFDGRRIVPLYFCPRNSQIFGVKPRNAAQMFALDALMNPAVPLVILKGPAGTAKTFLSMAAALEQTLEKSQYRRILVTRPNTKMDNDVGYLKGDEKEKVLPTIRGLLDNVYNLMSSDEAGMSTLDELMNRGIIDAQAMAYMRGRSITRQFVIVDEMQNATPTQALSLITRIGDESKIVLLGDPDQIDAPFLDRRSNGLVYASAGMQGSKLCCQLTFTERESTRSELAKDALIRLNPKGF